MDAFLSSLGRDGTHFQAGGTRKLISLPRLGFLRWLILTARKGGSASETTVYILALAHCV